MTAFNRIDPGRDLNSGKSIFQIADLFENGVSCTVRML